MGQAPGQTTSHHQLNTLSSQVAVAVAVTTVAQVVAQVGIVLLSLVKLQEPTPLLRQCSVLLEVLHILWLLVVVVLAMEGATQGVQTEQTPCLQQSHPLVAVVEVMETLEIPLALLVVQAVEVQPREAVFIALAQVRQDRVLLVEQAQQTMLRSVTVVLAVVLAVWVATAEVLVALGWVQT
jgi:hypothetical protein